MNTKNFETIMRIKPYKFFQKNIFIIFFLISFIVNSVANVSYAYDGFSYVYDIKLENHTIIPSEIHISARPMDHIPDWPKEYDGPRTMGITLKFYHYDTSFKKFRTTDLAENYLSGRDAYCSEDSEFTPQELKNDNRVERLFPKGEGRGLAYSKIMLSPLKPGKYCFVIEFNKKNAKGCIIVNDSVTKPSN